MSKKMRFLIMATLLVCSVFIVSPLFAENVAGHDYPAQPQAFSAYSTAVPDDQRMEQGWGTTASQYLGIPSAAFHPMWYGTAYTSAAYGYLHTTGGGGWFVAPVTLPAGAMLEGVTFYYYDNSANDIWLQFIKWRGITSPSYSLLFDWRSSGTPGYTATFIPVSQTVGYYGDDSSGYEIAVNLTEASASQMFRGVRIQYHLQISPAPATATFSDVPTTHPFFQYIEALYAARITTGYGTTGTYHPDDYVTRGQMAAFLARALGLQWY